ncbi:MAG: septum formation initiator family protein [Candidatus Theseobacter exili]|nr:septum formation initiator family protein [Candidatus Theseobacter exili]
MKKIVHYAFYAFFIAVILVGGVILFKSWNDLKKMRNNVYNLETKLRNKNNECSELHQNIYDLKTNPNAVEKVAREKFRLVKENEVILTYELQDGKKVPKKKKIE